MAEHGTLTKRAIDAMKPGDTIWDDGGKETVKGLGIRCRAGGAKSFSLKYRVGGRQRWLTVGRFGSPWTVDTARKQARKLLGEVAQGQDPAVAILTEKRAGSVAELCRQYREAAPTIITRRRQPKGARTLDVERGHIERHIVPLLGQRRLTAVSKIDVEKFQQQIAAGETRAIVKTKKRGRANVKGGPGAAARCLNTLSAIFTYAVKHGLRKDNPVHGVIRFDGGHGEGTKRYFSPDEMRGLEEAMTKVADLRPEATGILRLLALTGARKGEIAKLKWKSVELDNHVLRLPTSKTGSKLVFLGQPARDLLAKLPRMDGTDFVFPASRQGEGEEWTSFQGTSKTWRNEVCVGAKLEGRIHDFRHHYASIAQELGYTLPTIKALIGHGVGGATGRYIHHADPVLREAADTVSGEVWARMTGKRKAAVTGQKRRG